MGTPSPGEKDQWFRGQRHHAVISATIHFQNCIHPLYTYAPKPEPSPFYAEFVEMCVYAVVFLAQVTKVGLLT